MTLQHGHFHTGPVSLDYSRAHSEGRMGNEIFNDYGFVVRARTETGEDFHLWLFIYQLKGKEVVLDEDVTQTLLVYGNYSDDNPRPMADNPYINKGQNIEDYLPPNSIEIHEEKDQVTWSNAGRIMIGKPPHYHLGGTHAGVTVDLHFEEISDALYHHGRFEDLPPTEGNAGYLVHAKVTGSIEANGKVMKIKEGYGVHERILQSGVIKPRIHYMKERGLNWVHGYSKEFSWYIMSGDIGPNGKAFINIGGRLYLAEGAQNAWVNETDHWLDPKTRQLAPSRWHVWIVTEAGRLDATVTGLGRGFYTWTRYGGTLLVNQYAANAKTKFTRTDGTVIETDQMVSLEYMRTLYCQTEA